MLLPALGSSAWGECGPVGPAQMRDMEIPRGAGSPLLPRESRLFILEKRRHLAILEQGVLRKMEACSDKSVCNSFKLK